MKQVEIIKKYSQCDGIYDIVVKETTRGIVTEVTINDWGIWSGNEQFVGTTTCPPDKVYNEELEVNIAKSRAEIKHLRRRIDVWESARPDIVKEVK